MIFCEEHLRERGATLKTRVCIVGSGAGGASAAAELAAAGIDTVVIEAGSCIFPENMNQRELEMFGKLFWEKGGRASSDQGVKVHQGKGVGGSTLHNLNLCKRLPESLALAWTQQGAGRYVAGLQAIYPEVEQRLHVHVMTRRQLNENNRLFRQGCLQLGYRGGLLAHNRKNCIGSGFCALGCAFDAKQNALKIFIPAAIEGGAKVLANCFAEGLRHDGQRVESLHGRVRLAASGRLTAPVRIEAEHFLLAASATGTPALMERSELPDPHGQRGRHLHLHPGVVAAGLFPHTVEGWKGIPQSWECTELLDYDADKRIWLSAAFAHPAGTATELPGFGPRHAAWMRLYPRLGVLSAMLHDHSSGTVAAAGEQGVQIDYWPDAADRAQLQLGWQAMARILFAAGAEKVLIPYHKPLELLGPEQIEQVAGLRIAPHTQGITAVHPMGTARLGADPRSSVVDTRGRHHQMANVWVCDTSLFPSSLGVPPQLSAYASGLYVARELLKEL